MKKKDERVHQAAGRCSSRKAWVVQKKQHALPGQYPSIQTISGMRTSSGGDAPRAIKRRMQIYSIRYYARLSSCTYIEIVIILFKLYKIL